MIDCKLSIAVVENREDPLMLGRCKVRIFGLHTSNKIELPTDMLPWAHPLMPANSASISGIGWSPTGIVTGTVVLVTFLDEFQQQPIILGTLGGIPQTLSARIYTENTNDIVFTNEDEDLVSLSNNPNLVNDIENLASLILNEPNINDITEPPPSNSNQLYFTFRNNKANTLTVLLRDLNDPKRIIGIGKILEDNAVLIRLNHPNQWDINKQKMFDYNYKNQTWKKFENNDNVINDFFNKNFNPKERLYG